MDKSINVPSLATIDGILWAEVAFGYLLLLPDKNILKAIPDDWLGKALLRPKDDIDGYKLILRSLRVAGSYPQLKEALDSYSVDDLIPESFKDWNILIMKELYGSRRDHEIVMIDYETAMKNVVGNFGIDKLMSVYQAHLDTLPEPDREFVALLYDNVLSRTKRIVEGKPVIVSHSLIHPSFAVYLPSIIHELRKETEKYCRIKT